MCLSTWEFRYRKVLLIRSSRDYVIANSDLLSSIWDRVVGSISHCDRKDASVVSDTVNNNSIPDWFGGSILRGLGARASARSRSPSSSSRSGTSPRSGTSSRSSRSLRSGIVILRGTGGVLIPIVHDSTVRGTLSVKRRGCLFAF